ncbi:MAG TPA: hypothetical protein VEG44_10615 [Candidatus Acidoferrales bacterium]|nr:hypothetical protein [Candidatus Acidoferrales bacterium]
MVSWSAVSGVMDIPYNTLRAAKARREEKGIESIRDFSRIYAKRSRMFSRCNIPSYI